MKNVLVVDDEFDLTSTLRAILQSEGFTVDICDNGRAALARLHQTQPDLVLMDVMMPLLSGLEVLRTMRHTPQLASIPVILMSSMPPSVKRSEFQWQAFLRKPFTLQALLKVVGDLERQPAATE